MTPARSRVIVLVAALMAACVPRVPAPPPVDIAAPAEFPSAHYRQAATIGKKVLDIDPDRSVAVIEVRRGGRLAHLGHDHVVASRDLHGYVLPEEGRADLYIPLERLTVDEAALRAEAGLEVQPSQASIDGTRSNMLEKVLDTAHYPFALVQVTRQGTAWNVALTLHGVTRTAETPAHVEYAGGTLVASGSMAIRQSDFGIVPFSVLGGALQVQDRLEMRFRLVAKGG